MQEEDNFDSSWIITYSDAITLLLAFFIILFSVSNLDSDKMSYLKQKFNSQGDESMLNFIDSFSDFRDVEASQRDSGMEIEIKSSLFKSASSKLNSNKEIEKIATSLLNVDFDNYDIAIEGHSDDLSINNSKYSNNLALASARAIEVMKILTKNGIDEKHIQIISYGPNKPKVSIDESKDINQIRKENRRVVIYVKPKYL